MKVLITTDLFKPSINGVVTSVLNLEAELTKQGHEVRILTVSDRCSSYRIDQVYYIKSVPLQIYPDVRIPISRGGKYVRELIGWNPDVVHSQCEFFSYGYAKRIAKASSAILLHTYHTLYEQYTEYIPFVKTFGKASIAKWICKRLKGVDKIIAPTEKVRRSLQEYGIEQGVVVIPTGIRLARFQTTNCGMDESMMLRDKHHIPDGNKIILSLGRLGAEKRIEELLYGLKEVLAQRNDVILVIAGDGPAKGQLELLAADLKITESVRFTGMVKPDEVASYYQLADVFVCASVSETQGLTYIEAIASGLPLICRRDSCLEGVLKEGVNGYSYEATGELAGRICNIFGNKNWLELAGIHSRKIAENYGSEIFGIAVSKVYREVIQKREGKRYEGFIIYKEPKTRVKEWCRACYAYARRVS